ncbi:MAG: hypothetical protein Q4E13_09565 [Clostridia bacterium]|nr:hypothetical protein [Clostridia bacterium]
MTYIHVRTGRKMSMEVANALRDDIVDLLYMVRKSPATCMIDIDSGCNIRMGDGGEPCVYVDMRFAVLPEDEELRAFSVELASLFTEALSVEVNQMYFNFGTMPYCATGSVLLPEKR